MEHGELRQLSTVLGEQRLVGRDVGQAAGERLGGPATGFVQVDEITLDGKMRRIFNGWMFATSPGLNAVEHAIYDVWLADCKGGSTVIAETPAEPAPPPQRAPPRQQRPRQPPPPPPDPGLLPGVR